MSENTKTNCWLGSHNYKIIKEEDLLTLGGTKLGIIFVCQCTNCGRIKHYNIQTINTHI